MNKSGEVLRDIQMAIHSITTKSMSTDKHEGSAFTDYSDDDKSVWRTLRRELRQDGCSSSVVDKHKRLILDYIKELANRGLLDEKDLCEDFSDGKYDISIGDLGAPAR